MPPPDRAVPTPGVSRIIIERRTNCTGQLVCSPFSPRGTVFAAARISHVTCVHFVNRSPLQIVDPGARECLESTDLSNPFSLYFPLFLSFPSPCSGVFIGRTRIGRSVEYCFRYFQRLRAVQPRSTGSPREI